LLETSREDFHLEFTRDSKILSGRLSDSENRNGDSMQSITARVNINENTMMKALTALAILLGIVAITGCDGRTQTTYKPEKSPSQIVSDGKIRDTEQDEMQKACFGHPFVERGASHQLLCNEYFR